MTLDRLMFDRVSYLPVTVMLVCVRSKEYLLPHISDDAVMHVVVKGDVFEFTGCGLTNNGIVLCESLQ